VPLVQDVFKQTDSTKGWEMAFVLRVAFVVLFGAITMWAQTTSNSESFKIPAAVFHVSAKTAQSAEPFHFSLNLPRTLYEMTSPEDAANRDFSLESDASSAQSSKPSKKSFSYTRGYATRRKIHKYASIATLPLAVSEAIVGQKLIDNRADGSLRSAHSALTGGIGVLFGIESVTGVWNLWDARKLSAGRTRRMVHGILMLAADAGFFATAALAPHHEDGSDAGGNASAHRAAAYVSFGIASAGYLYMVFTK
jgi:hypothetical protein